MKRAIWITGVPSAGKSTLGERLVAALRRGLNEPCAFVDADAIRKQFWPHLGLSADDRIVNVTGLAELSGVLIRAGNNVVVACIAPDRRVRNRALSLIRVAGQDVAVHQVQVEAPLAVLKQRDVKGLYRAYDEGMIKGLTGVDAPYDPPRREEALCIDTQARSVDESVKDVLAYISSTPPLVLRESKRVPSPWTPDALAFPPVAP
jgi:adenylylsulfate kinase-like enzyme